MPRSDVAIAQSHPARMRGAASLRGLCGPTLEPSFTYLQIGGGEANLRPLEARFPEATFLRDDADAKADFVVALGAFSWLPASEQKLLLQRCRAQLAPGGLALVSYNTMPGWSLRGVLRDAMLRATVSDDDEERVIAARSYAKRLSRHIGTPDHPYSALLAAELERIGASTPRELLEDDLAENNEALHVGDFAARAGEAGLQYVAEMLPAPPDAGLDGETLPALCKEMPRLAAEQQIDMLCFRLVRASLLCADDVAVSDTPNDRRLAQEGFFSAHLAPRAEEPLLGPGHNLVFDTASGVAVEVERPLLKAALLTLAERYPRGLSGSELIGEAMAQLKLRDLLTAESSSEREMGLTLDDLRSLAARRQIELLGWRPTFVEDLDAKPRVHPISLAEATRSAVVTNARHEPTAIDPLTRAVLRLLDGTRDLDALVEAIAQRIDGGVLEAPDIPPDRRRDALTEMALRALFKVRNLGLLTTQL